MKGKKSLTILSIILLITVNIVSVTSLEIQNTNVKNNQTEPAELPIWSTGHEWTYNMDFTFVARNDNGGEIIDVAAGIHSMTARVIGTEKIDGTDHYKLKCSSNDMNGSISLFGIIDNAATFEGSFGGEAYVGVNTLGMRKFVFNVDADLHFFGTHQMNFDMTMNFLPCFDFLNFPITPNEEDWFVHIENASLDAKVYIDMLGGINKKFSDSMDFDDNLTLKNIETITLQPAGTFKTFRIGGDWGSKSDIWYSPEAGFLVKIDETLNWQDGKIDSIFELELQDTNYDASNKPPGKPKTPSGPTSGEADIEYEYSTFACDAEGDQLEYLFNWGDGTNSGWLGPFNAGETCTASHKWSHKGMYTVMTRAREKNTGLESQWSDPLPVTITGLPIINITIKRVETLDGMDFYNPVLPDKSEEPEFYFNFSINPMNKWQHDQYYNTVDGRFTDNMDYWLSSFIWQVNKSYIFNINKREIPFYIWLADYDSSFEGGDDLADVSGCNVPDVNGDDDFDKTKPPKRGAVFYQTYDIVSDCLKPYSTNADLKRDFFERSYGVYKIRGDHTPDNSLRDEDLFSLEQNDEMIVFTIKNNYGKPQAIASVAEGYDVLKTGAEIQFIGAVKDGMPDYQWEWHFGDRTASNEQNPKHTYTQHGTFTVSFTVKDSFGETNTFVLKVQIEKNNVPVLTNPQVTFVGKGTVQDMFTFSVHYYDQDEELLSKQLVYIDGVEHQMSGNGNDVDYIYETEGKQLGSGEHKYYFEFADEYGGTAKTVEDTFNVKKSRPMSKNYDFICLLRCLLNQFPMIRQLFL